MRTCRSPAYGSVIALERPNYIVGDPASIEPPSLAAYVLIVNQAAVHPARVHREVSGEQLEAGCQLRIGPRGSSLRAQPGPVQRRDRYVPARADGCSKIVAYGPTVVDHGSELVGFHN